jgi:cell division transport system ATP-binding protein
VGLGDRGHHFPDQLSGGEQQRVAVARALAMGPPLLLADEPTGNLDPNTAWEILDLLQYVHKKGTTVLMATHNYTLLNHVEGKRIVRLERGRILQDLKPTSASSRDLLSEGPPDFTPS